eukprot:gene35721-43322_t
MEENQRCSARSEGTDSLRTFIQLGRADMTSLACITTAIMISMCMFYSASHVTVDNSIDGFKRLLNELQRHKDLLPMDSNDIWGTIFTSLGLMIAASGGIGGGGILVPIFILVFGFSTRYAIPLSNFCILGSSITNMILNLVKRHPLADRPLVDWDLILVMEPLTMAGAIVGAFLSKILPDWLLVISLVALLAFTTWKTLEKGFEQYAKESKQHAEERNKHRVMKEVLKDMEAEEAEAEQTSLLPKTENKDGKGDADDIIDELNILEKNPSGYDVNSIGDVNQELEELLESERNTPMDKVVWVSVLVLVVVILNLIKGGGAFPSPLGIECGSSGYWFLTALVFIWVLGVSLYMRNVLIKKWQLKKKLRYRYLEGDVEWNPINTLVYPCICFFAGFFAGLFGIGGGIVKGPLMLQMGVHPLVASATCAVMIMFTSVAATTMFVAFGTLTWDYAWFFFILGLAATVVGQFGVSYLVVRYRRVSLVSLSIGAVVAISTVLMALQAVFSLVDASSESSNDKSNTLCS